MKIEKHELPGGTPIYKPKGPFQATVLSSRLLTSEGIEDGAAHILLNLKGSNLQYIEGQSIGVLPPGLQDNGKPHKLRLYSIASGRRGDDRCGQTVSLCVKRLLEIDPQNEKTYHGVASNYLCALQAGDKVNITGPVGKAFALPKNRDLHLILFATGTGIAPFRAFLKYIYQESEGWQGEIRLFMGAKRSEELLYCNSINNDLEEYCSQKNFKLYTARSREEKNRQGGRMYVQHRLEEHREEILPLVKTGHCVIYICGILGMEKGIEASLREIMSGVGIDWPSYIAALVKEGKWNKEVY